MKRINAGTGLAITAIVGIGVGYSCKVIDDRINGMQAVGGRAEYERQRAYHLERLRNNQHVDQAVRERDAAAIDAERDELGRNVPAQELGEELRRVK